MTTDVIEDLYCVTQIKCVAMGHCTARNSEEQIAADKLKQQMAVEEERLKRERAAKEAEAAKKREEKRQEEERIRKAEALKREQDRLREERAAAEKRRMERQIAEDARRLGLTIDDSRRLAQARDEAQRRMPRNSENCTNQYPAYDTELDLTQTLMVVAKAEKAYAAVDRSKACNGHPGTLSPLRCDKPADFFGLKIAACKATLSCPAREETRPCTRSSAQ